MGMSTRAHIQSLSSIEPILVKIFEVVERWVPVEVWVHDSNFETCCSLNLTRPGPRLYRRVCCGIQMLTQKKKKSGAYAHPP